MIGFGVAKYALVIECDPVVLLDLAQRISKVLAPRPIWLLAVIFVYFCFGPIMSLPPVLPQKALCLKPKWADLIIKGEKSVELRSRMTNTRGRVSIAHSAQLHGEVDIMDSFPVSDEWVATHKELHKVDDPVFLTQPLFAWILRDPEKYDHPVPYKHPRGAVIWVDLKKLADSSGKQSEAKAPEQKTRKSYLKRPGAKI